MRILFIAPFYEPAWRLGGMARSPSRWAHSLVDLGYSVDVLTTTADANHELDVATYVPINIDGTSVTYFPRWRWSRNMYISPDLMATCVKNITSYEIVHAVGLWTFPSVMSSWAAYKHKIPFVVSLHGTLMPWAYQHHGYIKRPFMFLIERNRLRQASAVICTSELERRIFNTLGIAVRTEVIPSVINLPTVVPQMSRNRFRARYGFQNSLVVLFVGRLVRNKGIHLSIAAFAKIVKHFPHASLLIVGPPEDNSARSAMQQVREMNLENKVRFMGMLTGDDYWDAIAGSDLFVLNSYGENFSNASAEALSMSVPVLLSDQVGIADLVKEYDAGNVTSLNVNDIAKTMASMLAQPERLIEMGRRGRRLVEDHFTSQSIGEKLKSLFEDVAYKARGQKPRA